ncbi:hypothetical protein CC2G_000229 [Coprinopsis cinerea AmutBmut pab1-1]|nr:hypothetical protein CC2G_000229 [Coprinopsis cinerea AmutBmut pab1-1]
MNRHFDCDEARAMVAAFSARGSQEEKTLPPMVAPGQTSEFSVTPFELPTCYRLTSKDDLDQEICLRIIGVICSKVLPPLLNKPRIQSDRDLRNLRQFVKVTGLGDPSFEVAMEGVREIFSKFEYVHGAERLIGVEAKLYEGELALDCHSRYFTDRERAPHEKHIPFPELVDPKHILEDIRGPAFIHGPDNHVEYYSKSFDGGHPRYDPIDPAILKEGDIVELSISFMSVPIKNGNFRLVTSLRAVALLSNETRKKSEAARTLETVTPHIAVSPSKGRKLKRRSLFSLAERPLKQSRSAFEVDTSEGDVELE